MIQYIDLFAGIGGFHQALTNLGGFECVFASELDKDASSVYEHNHGIQALSDITKIHEKNIPSHDLICAGFPCQPFSKSGYQQGFEDIRGTLFFDIIRIAKEHKPKVILLENVSNISTHDYGNTIRVIHKTLKDIGYRTDKDLILSPNDFGIPVNRPRTFIVATLDSFNFEFQRFHDDIFSKMTSRNTNNLYDYFTFDESPDESLYFTEYQLSVVTMWNEFYCNINLGIIGFPVWYDFFKKEPSPLYPDWKIKIIRKNNNLYNSNKIFIDSWEKKYDYLKWVLPTHRKFEWNCGKSILNIFEGLIQFRPSGVRIKKPDFFSTLVAMNHPQYMGKFKRRLSPNECKLLQSFPQSFCVHPDDKKALKQLGNAVNVKLVELIIKSIFHRLNFQE